MIYLSFIWLKMEFNTLPYEIQSKILRSYESLKPASLLVNKNIYKEAITSMYHDECDKIISEKEFKQYVIDYNPTLVCKFYFDKANEWWKYIAFIKDTINMGTISALILQHPGLNYCGTMTIVNVGLLQARELFDSMTDNNRAKPFEYDLMTMYYIYMNRQSCININPNYAKDKVLEFYDDVYSSLDYEDLLVFLRANAKIMGIYVKGFAKVYQGEFNYGIVDEEVARKIANEVELLSALILKRLNNL